MSEQATTQQDTREQQVEALARVLHKPSPADATQIGASWRRSESLRNAAALLDGPVARMIAEAEQAAERRGAIKALRGFAEGCDSPWQQYADDRADNIEDGADL